MSASLAWVSWKPAIGRPNCSRSQAYAIAVSRQSRAAPSAPQAMPDRASVRQDSGALSPRASGSTASAGSRTSSSTISPVEEARSDSLWWISLAVTPGRRHRHDEAADPVVGPGPDHGDVGHRGVGDPHLGAAQHPVVAVADGAGRHRGRIGAVVGLGQAEAADRRRRPPSSGSQLLLLLLRAEPPDRVHGQRPLHADQAAHAGVAGLELHAGQPVGDRGRPRRSRTRAGACRAGRAQPKRLASSRVGGATVLEPLPDVRTDLLVDHAADDIAHRALLVAEQRVQREQVERGGTAAMSAE